jgi:hypothetical protein
MKVTAVTPFIVDPGYGKNWLYAYREFPARTIPTPRDEGPQSAPVCYHNSDTLGWIIPAVNPR